MHPIQILLGGALILAASCASTDAAGDASPSASVPVSGEVLTSTYIDTKGESHDLSGVLAAGKPVALVFWQPWCGACLAEAPTVVAAQKRLGDEIAFYGVVSGPDDSVNEADVTKAMLDTGMTYPTIRDRDLRLTEGLGVDIQPTIVILDPAGTITYKDGVLPAEWH